MFKKYRSILMMFSALAILLGHDVIAHQHHDYEQQNLGHHHSGGESHSDGDNDSEDSDFLHLFSTFQHGEDSITFLRSHNLGNSFSKQLSPFIVVLPDTNNFQRFPTFARQNSPPYKVVYFNSHHYLPSGLRAPPVFIA